MPIFIGHGAPLTLDHANGNFSVAAAAQSFAFEAALSAFDAASKSGYNLARMPFVVVLAPEAVEDLRRLTAHVRAAVRTALETHLRHEPGKTSRSRKAVARTAPSAISAARRRSSGVL